MRVVDSHTGGEPTRVVLEGGPDLGSGSLPVRAKRMTQDHMDFCQSLLCEPRGQPAMVGALLVEPSDPRCLTGVIFFDAAAVLEMCGHGTIGLMVTLAHLGMAAEGSHLIETPAGLISVELHDKNTVTVTNVPSRVVQRDVVVTLPDLGAVSGTIAYGGNWFYIVEPSPIAVLPKNTPELTQAAVALRRQLNAEGSGVRVDHIIFQDPAVEDEIHGRNFVLCPDDTYDRSPCGTGCSAILACLADAGRLSPGQEITQQSIIQSAYRLSYQPGEEGQIVPKITGQAHVIAQSTLMFASADPFVNGIPA